MSSGTAGLSIVYRSGRAEFAPFLRKKPSGIISSKTVSKRRWSDEDETDEYDYMHTDDEVIAMLREKGLPHATGELCRTQQVAAAYPEVTEQPDPMVIVGTAIARANKGRGGLPSRLTCSK